MKKIFSVLCGVMMLGLAACNTMDGLGKDTAKAGDALSNAARNVKDEMKVR